MFRHLSCALLFVSVTLLAACDGSNIKRGSSAVNAPPAPVISTIVLPRATRGAPYSVLLTATTPVGTDPLTWSLSASSSPLPAGITLGADGTLSGTPTAGGLFVPRFRCVNNVGGEVEGALDIVVYEPIGYVHTPDAYDVPSNDSFASATNLGGVTQSAPIIQQMPLSVTSDPADPNTDPRDYFKFTTPSTGRVHIEVYFDFRTSGRLFPTLGGEHNGNAEEVVNGVPNANGDDSVMLLDNAPGGTWYLKVEAQLKNGSWNTNGYTFRIMFEELTIASELVEHDLSAGAMNSQLQASVSGLPASTANWNLVAGNLPTGVNLASNGMLSGTPTQDGLFDATIRVELNGFTSERVVQVRVYNSATGNYWQRFGQHRYYDASRTNGEGEYHEHYSEAMVVAPHPSYGSEGAIYVLGGRVADTVNTVYVFHTAHQSNPDLSYKLEDIGCPLSTARQYLGAVFLQHTYGGYIYVVGGELYSNTAPSSGDFTRTVERMQVADGSGVALSSPGPWEIVSELPSGDGGRAVEGWAEGAVVAHDAGVDADDRIYLLAGRVQVETTAGSGTYGKEENKSVLMYEAPVTPTGLGFWHRKPDATPYTPRRFPAAGMINGRIYLAGGTGSAGTLDTIEMYQPDPSAVNPAISILGSTNYPTLAEPVYYSGSAVDNGTLYVLNGWRFQGYSPVATSRLQGFEPNAAGTGGTVTQLAVPDNGSGYHSAVVHDGELWFATGRDSFVQTPHYSLRYTPAP